MFNIFLTQYDGAILGPIAKLLGYILEGIYNVLANFGITNSGLCIIIFTFIINALMIPLTVKQQKFSKMTSVMQPELAAIQKKYNGKKDEASLRAMQFEQQAVYQKYGTSPTGGCLPMLITLPIILALYRVIQNIPAYVPAIKDIYETASAAIMSVPDFATDLVKYIGGQEGAYEAAVAIQTKGWGDDLVKALTDNSNYVIDLIAQFKTSTWDSFMETFGKLTSDPAVLDTIKTSTNDIKDVNSFLGLNIADNPSFKSVSVVIPVLAVVTQFVNTKISMAGTNDRKSANNDDPNAKTMQTMNNVMPFISGFMCLVLPIGIGLYWIAGNVFRIVQQLFVNIYMSKVDVEDLRQKNLVKAEKKRARREKMGIPTAPPVQEVASKKTSTISNAATSKTTGKSQSSKKSYEVKDYQKKDVNPKSIASIANMMNNSRDD